MDTEPREDSPSPKSEAAYERLKQLVIHGRIRPGRHLVVHEVADQLGIGITPTRDGMVQLSAEGFLLRDNNHGFSTKEFRIDEQQEILTLCCIFLSYALRAAGDRVPVQLLSGLAALENAPAQSPEDAELVAMRIKEMYLEAARASGNDVLYAQCRIMVDRSHLVRKIDLQMGNAGRLTIDDLRAIGVAMANGDPERAVAAAQAVLSRRIERMPLLIREANFIASEASFP